MISIHKAKHYPTAYINNKETNINAVKGFEHHSPHHTLTQSEAIIQPNSPSATLFQLSYS